MPAAAAIQATEALGVHRDELARDPHVELPEAPSRFREQVHKAMGAVAAQDPVDARGCEAQDWPDPVRTPALLEAQRKDARLERIGRAVRRAVWATRAVGEVRRAVAPAIDRSSTDPQVSGGPTHPDPLRLRDKERAHRLGRRS